MKQYVSLLIYTSAICIAAFSLLSSTAFAQMKDMNPIKGMNHMVITPPENAPVKQEEEKKYVPAPAQHPAQTETNSPAEESKPLEIKDSLVKPEDLKPWGKLSLAVSQNKRDMATLLYELDHNRGEIPPQGLLLSAQTLARAGDMEHAALYYLVGQLRLEFDMARWPSRPSKSYLARKESNARKSEDQALPMADKPDLNNPHQNISTLASNVSVPIFEWLVKDPQRLKRALDQAEIWDLSAPYAYDPGYDLDDPVPFKEWKKLLPHTRNVFFGRMRNLQHNLEKYIGKK